jgi:precorrin-2/cobalt-factor-2 C20-methyltransferase
VLLKVHRVLDRIVELLDDLGLAQHSVLVEHCGRPDQRIVHDVRSLRGAQVDYFSLMIVRT